MVAGRLNTHLPVNVKDVGKARRTLLINWWRNKPLPPNCNDMPANFVGQLTGNNVRLWFDGSSSGLNVGGMLTSGATAEAITDLCCKQYVNRSAITPPGEESMIPALPEAELAELAAEAAAAAADASSDEDGEDDIDDDGEDVVSGLEGEGAASVVKPSNPNAPAGSGLKKRKKKKKSKKRQKKVSSKKNKGGGKDGSKSKGSLAYTNGLEWDTTPVDLPGLAPFSVSFPPDEKFHFPLPDVIETPTSHRLQWYPHQVNGNVNELGTSLSLSFPLSLSSLPLSVCPQLT